MSTHTNTVLIGYPLPVLSCMTPPQQNPCPHKTFDPASHDRKLLMLSFSQRPSFSGAIRVGMTLFLLGVAVDFLPTVKCQTLDKMKKSGGDKLMKTKSGSRTFGLRPTALSSPVLDETALS